MIGASDLTGIEQTITGPPAPADPIVGLAPVPQVDPARVIVAIPTLNEAAGIRTCLQSLLDDAPWMEQVHVVVADGGSTDGTQEIVRTMMQTHPNLHLIDNPLKLQAAAINQVAAHCTTPTHDILVRCDAHARYPQGYVRRIAEAFETHPDAASIATPMDAQGESCFQRAAAWIVDTPLGSGGSAHRGGQRSQWVDHGHHAGFRLDWFRRINGYDTGFSHNEDAEYDHRLGQAGGRVWLDAGIRLDYHMRSSLGALARQYRNYGRGRARTVLKHRMRPRLRQMIPVLNFLVLVLSLLLAPWQPLLMILPAGYLGLLAATSLLAMTRIGICGLWAGPALGVMHNAWGAGFLAQLLRGGRP